MKIKNKKIFKTKKNKNKSLLPQGPRGRESTLKTRRPKQGEMRDKSYYLLDRASHHFKRGESNLIDLKIKIIRAIGSNG